LVWAVAATKTDQWAPNPVPNLTKLCQTLPGFENGAAG